MLNRIRIYEQITEIHPDDDFEASAFRFKTLLELSKSGEYTDIEIKRAVDPTIDNGWYAYGYRLETQEEWAKRLKTFPKSSFDKSDLCLECMSAKYPDEPCGCGSELNSEHHQKLLKMAQDEAEYYCNHSTEQEHRADILEAENEELKDKLLMEQQTKGILCDKCGWSMKFPDELCRCELEDELESTRNELERIKSEYAEARFEWLLERKRLVAPSVKKVLRKK